MADSPASLDVHIASLAQTAIDLQTRIASLHGQLMLGPAPALEGELDELRAERDALLLQWGRLALRWQMSGGQINLTAREASAQPAPVEDVEDVLDDLDLDAPEVDLETISKISRIVMNPNWGDETPDPGFDVAQAQEIATRLGEPRLLTDDAELLAEAASLDRELQRLAAWAEYPRNIQRAFIGLVACRLRALQEDAPSNIRAILERQIRKDFARLTQFSSDHQPGWVTGLSRLHKPETGSWISDAEFWWKTLRTELGGLDLAVDSTLNPEIALNALQGVVAQDHPDPAQVRQAASQALAAGVIAEDPRLVRLLIGRLDALTGEKSLKRLRRAVRTAMADDDDDDDGQLLPDDLLPPDWPFLDRTRGHFAVMVGGETRERRRALIQDALGFSGLEWISGYEIRHVQSLAERITSGRVGFVILLARFISHKVTDILIPTLKASGIDWVVVRQGYGLQQISQAIERYLDEPT
ncbi:MAG: hypothetical protein ACI9U2_000362 [Bradymonadia bacterium]|jgi:hypothetical protein